MKRILALLITIIISLSFCGCKNTNIEKTPIKINLPTDNSVNGYRLEDKNDDTPDIISDIEISPSINSSNKNTTTTYCGNKNSKKFHKSSCVSVKNTKESNKIYFKTRSEYINYGYAPCKICNP